jgi:hypothetical protein
MPWRGSGKPRRRRRPSATRRSKAIKALSVETHQDSGLKRALTLSSIVPGNGILQSPLARREAERHSDDRQPHRYGREPPKPVQPPFHLGLTTLKNRHVAVDGNEVRFRFTGKSGKQWSLRVRDRRVAKITKACQDLPGQELLQYVDEACNCQDVTSTDVNEYLKEITGKNITAKDFRTWAGTVLAAMALNELESFDSAAQAKRNLRAAIEKVASRLGNTPTICRKCCVHPEVLSSYMDGNLVLELKSQAESELVGAIGSLKPEEAAVLALLRGRLEKEVERSKAGSGKAAKQAA